MKLNNQSKLNLKLFLKTHINQSDYFTLKIISSFSF